VKAFFGDKDTEGEKNAGNLSGLVEGSFPARGCAWTVICTWRIFPLEKKDFRVTNVDDDPVKLVQAVYVNRSVDTGALVPPGVVTVT
jgi:hypothetical protein